MTRKFSIPQFYRSDIVSSIKAYRRDNDRTKRDFAPFTIKLGTVEIKLARHFGFCFGVENAIEIAYRAIEENPGKRVFLLSEMIHNPHVNNDLISRGVRFLQSTRGETLIPFSELAKDDIVIVPAFGTTVELFQKLSDRGIDPRVYNATCPFVERVWKRGKELAERGYTLVIHGKHDHEETRATFSHTCEGHAGVVVRDYKQAELLSEFVAGRRPLTEFMDCFTGLTTDGFDPSVHLSRIGVINQTTMLATETHAISKLLKQAIEERRQQAGDLEYDFADTRDTLCYATTENQDAVRGLIEHGGDIALVVGGYNSSNTSHLAELLEEVLPTYYVKDADELISADQIRHLDMHSGNVMVSEGWLKPDAFKAEPLRILVSAGASCPDAQVDQVIVRVCELLGLSDSLALWSEEFAKPSATAELKKASLALVSHSS
jgi:4-hydroxy-3-methylbut-2-en-1-yl diphosphate reductase